MSSKALAGFTGLFGIIAVVLAVMCASCTKDTITQVKGPTDTLRVVDTLKSVDTIHSARKVLRPGAFSVEYNPGSGLEKRLAKVEAGSVATINLDTINKSKSFLFVIKNTGESPILGCRLSIATGDSLTGHYSVTPSSIAALKSDFDTTYSLDSIQQNIVPIVVVSMNHGWDLNGTDWAGLLKPGYNVSQLAVYGVTRVYRDTLDTIGHLDTISAKVNLRVWANESDFKVIGFVDSTRTRREFDTTITKGMNFFQITQNPTYWQYIAIDRIAIVNVGNVPAYLIKTYGIDSMTKIISDTIQFSVQDTVYFGRIDSLNGQFQTNVTTNIASQGNISVYSKSVINHINLPPQQVDGNINFLFSLNPF